MKKGTNKKENRAEKITDMIKMGEVLEKRGLLAKESIIKDFVENETIKQIGKVILAAAFISGVIAISAVAPNIFGAFGKILKNNKRQKTNKTAQQKTMRTIYNLQKRKLIEYDRCGDKIMLKITPQGRSIFLRQRVLELKIKEEQKWDKIWRIILFDIPNNLGARRDIFRHRLKKMGFYQFQKSAFVTPFPCQLELETVLDYYSLYDYVTYLEATSLSGEEKCRQYFNI
jgi:hypothetical protein